jgi:hypothetical protein
MRTEHRRPHAYAGRAAAVAAVVAARGIALVIFIIRS